MLTNLITRNWKWNCIRNMVVVDRGCCCCCYCTATTATPVHPDQIHINKMDFLSFASRAFVRHKLNVVVVIVGWWVAKELFHKVFISFHSHRPASQPPLPYPALPPHYIANLPHPPFAGSLTIRSILGGIKLHSPVSARRLACLPLPPGQLHDIIYDAHTNGQKTKRRLIFNFRWLLSSSFRFISCLHHSPHFVSWPTRPRHNYSSHSLVLRHSLDELLPRRPFESSSSPDKHIFALGFHNNPYTVCHCHWAIECSE